MYGLVRFRLIRVVFVFVFVFVFERLRRLFWGAGVELVGGERFARHT